MIKPQMQALGLSRPALVAYELGEPALTDYRHPGFTEAQYIDMWEKFVREL